MSASFPQLSRISPRSWTEWSGWRRGATWFWAILLAVTVGKLMLKPRMHTVYAVYADMGRLHWNAGHPPREQTLLQCRIYHPFFVELIAPFSRLPDRLGGPLWALATIGVFLAGFHLVLKRFYPGWGTGPLSGLAFLLLPWFGIASIYNGQANVLIAGCLMAGAAWAADRRYSLAGLCLAVPIVIKVYPAAFAMVLAVLFPPLAGWVAAWVAALSALPFLLHEPASVLARYAAWWDYLVHGLDLYPVMVAVDLRSLWMRWIGPVSRSAWLPVQAATGLTVMATVWRYRREAASRDALACFAWRLTLYWMVLFGPASEEATYLLVAGPLALDVVGGLRAGGGRSVAAGLAGLAAGPMQTSLFSETVRKWSLGWKLAPLGLVVMALRCAAEAWHTAPPASAELPSTPASVADRRAA